MNWTYKLRRHQHTTYAAIQGILVEYWALYAAGDLTTSALPRNLMFAHIRPGQQLTFNTSDFSPRSLLIQEQFTQFLIKYLNR